MPDPRSLLRLVTLAGFLVLVAVGLWLVDADWPVVIGVMIGAWALAALVEWAAWRQERLGRAPLGRQSPVGEPQAVPPGLPPPEPRTEEESGEGAPAWKAEPIPAIAQPQATEEAPPEPAPAHPLPVPVPAPGKERDRPPLRPVPAPAPQPPPRPTTPPAAARANVSPDVVDLRRRATAQARRWNLWDLERLAREELQVDPERLQELSYLFVHMRQFASPDGSLPTEFDPLVRESLGDLLEQRG